MGRAAPSCGRRSRPERARRASRRAALDGSARARATGSVRARSSLSILTSRRIILGLRTAPSQKIQPNEVIRLSVSIPAPLLQDLTQFAYRPGSAPSPPPPAREFCGNEVVRADERLSGALTDLYPSVDGQSLTPHQRPAPPGWDSCTFPWSARDKTT